MLPNYNAQKSAHRDPGCVCKSFALFHMVRTQKAPVCMRLRTHLNVVSILCVHIAEQCQLTFRESSDFYMSYVVKWSMWFLPLRYDFQLISQFCLLVRLRNPPFKCFWSLIYFKNQMKCVEFMLKKKKTQAGTTTICSTVGCPHQIGLQYVCSDWSARCCHTEHIKQCQY